ncbi:MAG: protein kinase [Pirellulaceae bacterium]
MAPSTCPEPNELAEFLCGKLTDDRLCELESHLTECDACGDTIRALNVEDTFANLFSEQADSSDADQDKGELVSLVRSWEAVIEEQLNEPHEHGLQTKDAQQRAYEVESRLSPAQDETEIGRLANYRILRLLGTGGMGVVYLAEDTQLRRPVALKILRPSLGEAAQQRFLQEARAAAAIEHDHVVTIYHVGSEGPLAFLAMQYLHGETLEKRLHRDNHLSADEVIAVASQIAEGLAAAHEKNLIHRDIKPANILISDDGKRATILDFGLAYAVDDNPELTETGMVAGTPAYMSPEQARGQLMDERTDLFSLGTLMYRCLTGQMPFPGKNALAVIRSIQCDTPMSPRQIDLRIPRFLSDTVMDLLEKDVRLRPEKASIVVESLRTGRRPARAVADNRLLDPSAANGNFRHRIWIAALAFFGLFGAAAIYTIQTDRGQIIVKTDDPQIQVEVLKAGELVRIIDPSTDDTVTIQSGEYQVRLKDSASQATISPQKLTIRRHDAQVVTVEQKIETASADDIPIDGNYQRRDELNQVVALHKQLLQEVVALRELGKPAEAIKRLNEHGTPHKIFAPYLHLEYARAYRMLGEFEPANEMYGRVIGVVSTLPSTIAEIAQFYEEQQQFEYSFELYNRAYLADPTNEEVSKARDRVRKLAETEEPQRIFGGSEISLSVLNSLPHTPIDGIYRVEPGGTLALGVAYGRVNVDGLTLQEAETAIRDHLSEYLQTPVVQLTFAANRRQAPLDSKDGSPETETFATPNNDSSDTSHD